MHFIASFRLALSLSFIAGRGDHSYDWASVRLGLPAVLGDDRPRNGGTPSSEPAARERPEPGEKERDIPAPFDRFERPHRDQPAERVLGVTRSECRNLTSARLL